LVHAHRCGSKASDAGIPDGDGRDRKSDRHGPGHEPSPTGVTALANATDPFSKPFLEQIQLGGDATRTAIKPIRISNNEEFENAFAAMESDRPDAIIVQPSLPSKRAAELALQHRVPAVSVPRWFVDEGGLMSYSAIYAEPC
jgi:putative ABC transport system substrate-binding protein